MGDSINNKRRLIVLAAFAAWFVLNLVLCVRHEGWLDEAQAWNIANRQSFSEMIGFMWQEGHPWLWHAILIGLNAIGITYTTVKWFAFLCAAVGVFLYVWKSSLSPFFVCASLFFPFINYYAPTWARPYCLVLLFGALLGTLWPQRRKYPWVIGLLTGLGACTHLLVAPAFALIAFLALMEQRAEKRSSVSFLVSCITPIIVFYGPFIGWIPVISKAINLSIVGFVAILAAIFFVIVALIVLICHTGLPNRLFCNAKSIRRMWIAATVLATISIPLTSLVSTLASENVNPLLRYNLIAFGILPIVLWLAKETVCERDASAWIKPNSGMWGTVVLLLLALFCVLINREPISDFVLTMSSAEETVEYIQTMDSDETFIVTSQENATSLVPLLSDRHLLYLDDGSEHLFVRWIDRRLNNDVQPDEWIPKLKQFVQEHGHVCLLMNHDSEFIGLHDWLYDCIQAGKCEVLFVSEDWYPQETFLDVNTPEDYMILRINASAFDIPITRTYAPGEKDVF